MTDHDMNGQLLGTWPAVMVQLSGHRINREMQDIARRHAANQLRVLPEALHVTGPVLGLGTPESVIYTFTTRAPEEQ